MSLDARLQKIWYDQSSSVGLLLLPLSWLFGVLIFLRQAAYTLGLLKSYRLSKPVIVVGNLTVGGTGKTPVVIWLASKLQGQGIKVGVITRGYGGNAQSWPQQVIPSSDPVMVGDEAILIARRTNTIVVAGPDRVAAGKLAIEAGAEVLISDDGLQHYRLQRDCELVVVDGKRMFGNGYLLPAGPLREPISRLKRASLVLLNQRGDGSSATFTQPSITFRVLLGHMQSLTTGQSRSLAELQGQQVHVVTAIGHPQAFISALEALGMQVLAHLHPDHALFNRADIDFGDQLPVLMTEKDAVKCQNIADSRHWFVSATADFSETDQKKLLDCVQQAIGRSH
jgi:tetraacyldisaccharide 4'-kinase